MTQARRWERFLALGSHGVLYALVLLLIWGQEVLPVTNEPTLAHATRIFHALRMGDAGTAQWYTLRPIWTEVGFYWLAHWLQLVFSNSHTLKILESAAVIGIASGTALLLKSNGRSPLLSVLAVPLALGTLFQIGYLPFLLGVPLVLVGLSLAEVAANLENQRLARAARAGALGLLCAAFWFHAVLALIFGVLLGAALLMRKGSRRERTVEIVLVLGVMVSGLAVSVGADSPLGSSDPLQPPALGQSLGEFALDFMQWTTRGADHNVLIAFGLALISPFLVFERRQDRLELSYRRPLVLLALTSVAYLSLSRNFASPWQALGAGGWMPLFAGLLAVVCVPYRVRRARDALAAIPAFVFAALHCMALYLPFRQFADDAAGLDRVAAAITRGSTVLPLSYQEATDGPGRTPFGHFLHEPYRQLARWTAARASAYQPYSLCGLPRYPVSCRRKLSKPDDTKPWLLKESDLTDYRSVVVFADGNPAHRRATRERFARLSMDVTLELGNWQLWGITGR